MERMSATVDILRNKYNYKGYVHLKTLPGASQAAIERACSLATRTSVNLEAPRRESLAKIAPEKDLILDVLDPLRWIATEMKHHTPASPHQRPVGSPYGPGLSAGVTTQFVVGAGGETDEEIIKSTAWLYKNLRLHRAYFSAFQPVKGTPLDALEPTPPLREHRLYQADFLLRQYSFSAAELPFNEAGSLPLDKDPKLVWALQHPSMFPVEVNQASEARLLRVPGIGPISARRIREARREGKIRTLRALRRTGAVVKRARNFVTLAGKFYPGQNVPEALSPACPATEAPGLFASQAVGF
jgi:predicted DNA-binding helix-hairpin-helix protein